MACPCMGSSDGDCILPIADDDVIKWKKFPRHWPFVRGIHRWPVNSQHKGQWRGALVLFSLISAWINRWVNNCEAGDLRRHHAHYKVTVMSLTIPDVIQSQRDIGRPEWYQSYSTNSIWLFWSIVPEEVGLLMIQRSNWHAHHWCQSLSFQTILHWKQLQKDSDYPCRNLYGSFTHIVMFFKNQQTRCVKKLLYAFIWSENNHTPGALSCNRTSLDTDLSLIWAVRTASPRRHGSELVYPQTRLWILSCVN